MYRFRLYTYIDFYKFQHLEERRYGITVPCLKAAVQKVAMGIMFFGILKLYERQVRHTFIYLKLLK